MTCVHASCVAIGESGILLRGAPGSGKSSLALRLIDRGACLVADDQVQLSRDQGGVKASAPAPLHGLLEVRGLGIVKTSVRSRVTLALIVDLTRHDTAERLPAPRHCVLEGVDLPCLTIDARHPDADAVLRLAIRTMECGESLAGALGDSAPASGRVTA
jgi:serine kinase of HPr protein (carbohydrate metabolism regulator)